MCKIQLEFKTHTHTQILIALEEERIDLSAIVPN